MRVHADRTKLNLTGNQRGNEV